MKSNLKPISVVIIFISIFILNLNQILANDILIDAKTVEIIKKGNVIVASESVNITDGNKLKITGNEAIYNKSTQIVEIEGNVTFLDNVGNYRVESDKIIFNRKNNTVSTVNNTLINLFDNNNNLTFEGIGKNSFFDQNSKTLEINENVILNDFLNDYKIYSEKIIYNQLEETIKSYNDTKINYGNELIILSKDINYNKKKNTLFTKKETEITDKFQNKINLSSFNFDLNKKILKANQIKLSDIENNKFELSSGFIDLNSNELVGSDFILKLNKGLFGNSENDPRLIGRYIIDNESETVMKKGVFTTCKKIDGKCPTWSISADEVLHKKNKKRIEYKNAWIAIHDVPVAYFPYFYHPDPTVERQSGFLFPQFINSSNLGFSTQIPYFKAIDEDKDMTISPRVYSNNNLFVQTEYRQAFKNSKLSTDLSFNKKNTTNSHFFSTLTGGFENSFYEMKIQTVSNKDYLKKYQITSPLINDQTVLSSMLYFEKNFNNYNFSTSLNVTEDLSKTDSDKYEYELPNYELIKTTDLRNNNFFNSFNFKSSGSYRKFNTNVDEMEIINDFLLISNEQNLSKNLQTDFNLLIRNINTYGDLSSTFKENEDYKILNSLLLNYKYPLFKDDGYNKSFLTPIASFRFSPNKGLNLNDEKTLLSFQDLFVIDRINNKTIEAGGSITLGLEYLKQNKLDEDKLKFGLGINFRENEDNDLPTSSSLGQKTSDLIGYSGINITENLSFNYNFSIDQNLSETNYSLISANYNGNKFKTSFEYMEKSKFIGDESYLSNLTELELDKSNSLAFETNKNLDKNLTNYYNLIYKYKNDCLEASVVYNKQFYEEDTINSGKNIFFKISFIPFGTVNTPNIND